MTLNVLILSCIFMVNGGLPFFVPHRATKMSGPALSLYNFHAENIFFSLQSGTIIGSTNVVNQLQTEIWEPVDPNVTLEG